MTPVRHLGLWNALAALVTLIVGGPLAPPASAASASVGTEAQLRNAFQDADVTQIDLTSDITIQGDNCVNGGFIRQSATALVVDGHGFTVTQTCPLQVFLQLEQHSALTFENITIAGGRAGPPGGGAIGTAGSVTVISSTLSDNQSTAGGGAIAADGAVKIVDSTLTGNINTGTGLLEFGGAVTGGTVTIVGSTLSDNVSFAEGGAISGVEISIVNSTVARNHAVGSGGGIVGFLGVQLVYATVVGNTVTSPKNGANISAPGAPFQAFGSVIAEAVGAPSCYFGVATPTSNGYNFGDDGSCGLTAPTDHNSGGSSDLGPLASNGGPTDTLLPQAGSPLIGAIPPASCQADGAAGITTDQRGVPRGGGSACDIGSVQVGSGAGEPPPPGAEPGSPPPVTKGFEDLLQLFTEAHVPGTVLGVTVPGQGRFVGVTGTSGLGDPTPLHPDARFRIGSITKTFTATAVLQLVVDCRLDLDDTIERWQPDLPEASNITVRELLNHTSGIPDFSDDAQLANELQNHPFRVIAPQTFVDVAATLPRAFPPGAAWEYSNTNYFILGLIVEAISGQPLEQVIEHRILDPLDLDATSLPTTPAIPEPSTSGALVEIDEDLNVISEQSFNLAPSWFWAAGAMVSNLADLEVWAKALVDGTLLSPETQRARLTLVPMVGPEVPDGTTFIPLAGYPGPELTANYGLGLFAIGGYIGHNGDVPGYEAVMMYDPHTGTLIVELQNARLAELDHAFDPPVIDVQLPSASVPRIAGILGQDPPLPPNPTGPTEPPCAHPTPPRPTPAPPPPPRPGVSAPATPVAAAPRFTG